MPDAIKEAADKIGDSIIAENTGTEDDIVVGQPPLGGVEHDVDPPADPPVVKEGDDAEKGDKTKTEQTLAGGQFPATAKGITDMETALKTHQSAADKHKATLVEAGFIEGEDGKWVKPAESAGSVKGVALGFDPDILARDILGPPVESDDNDAPKDYDPTNPLHVQKLMRGEVRAERERTENVNDVANQIREIIDLNPGITKEEIEDTVNWYKGGGLRLASLHAIHKGTQPVGSKAQTSEVDTSEAVTKADKDAAVAAALKDFDKAQADRENIVPGTAVSGTGALGDEEKSPGDEIGDNIVTQSHKDRSRRI